jgi:hypothetical protein
VYAAAAFLFGNTPTIYLALLAVISALNMCLAFVLVRRAVDRVPAVLVGVGLMALLPVPGALAGGFTVSPYLVLERTLLLLVALLWKPVERPWSSSLSMGAALGVWQGVKFGGGIFAGAAVVLLDLLYILAAGVTRERVSAWGRSLLLMCGMFAAIQLVWIGLAFNTGSPGLARDTIFPLYMFNAYSVITPDIRWPLWNGWRLAVGQYLLPLSAGVLGVAGLAGWLRVIRHGSQAERDRAGPAGACVLTGIFYVICAFTYFRHVYHFQQFLWALVPPAAWQLWRCTPRVRTAAVLLWAPGVLLVIRSMCVTAPPPAMEEVRLPTGGTILVEPAMKARLSFLSRLLISEADRGAVLYTPVGSGWHFAYDVPLVTRHSWFFAHDVIRPYDRETLVRSFDRTGTVVACGTPGVAEAPLSSVFPLPPEVAAEVYPRLDLWRREAGCRLYRVRRQ